VRPAVTHAEVVELIRRDSTPDEHKRIRDLWKRHSIAEDARDIAGLISTLTEDCVYELVPANKSWKGHAGATQFYTELLTAFPDIKFDLTDIVIGPQGVCEEASVTATHRGEWLGVKPTGEPVNFRVVIFFPWDPTRQKFRGERIYLEPASIFRSAAGLSFGAFDV
jgi:predicted ester cyclase